MPLKSIGDGTYVANWVPSVGGNYLIQIFIDGCRTGKKYDTPQFLILMSHSYIAPGRITSISLYRCQKES